MSMDVFEMRRRVTEDDLANLVERFYERVRADSDLGPMFETQIDAEAWPAHLARTRDFWSTVLLGTGLYRGNPMEVHRSIPGLQPAHFAQWLDLFGVVLHEQFSQDVAEAILQRARRMAESLSLYLYMKL